MTEGPQAVIVDGTRSPIGRAKKGSLKDVRPDDLAGHIVQKLMDRLPEIDRESINDLICGCGLPHGEAGFNVARPIVFLSGLPESVPGTQVNRFCASSLQAIRMAFHAIKAGEGDTFICAGVESSTRVEALPRGDFTVLNPKLFGDDAIADVYIPMGLTAENVAEQYGVERPQVHGACRDVLTFARDVTRRELGSVTDNPVVFSGSGDVVSSGNFHGEPLGFALDFMATALSELGSISERRTDRLLDPDHSSGLPPFLTERAGTNSGFMLTQYTQAALVAENRILSTPATVDTIPTSGSQEDHVSMGWNAALKLRRVLRNAGWILAVEALCAAQGMELRAPLRGAAGTSAALAAVREVVPHLDRDRPLGPDIERVSRKLLLNGELVGRAEDAAGGLT